MKQGGYVRDILSRPRPGGWHDVELVSEDQEFLIALVDEGNDEKGAVLGERLIHFGHVSLSHQCVVLRLHKGEISGCYGTRKVAE